MSIASKYRPQYTYDDYSKWEGRWELIEGMPYAMSPAPAVLHQVVNANLYAVFTNSLGAVCKQSRAYLPIDWRIGDDTVVQPDLLIVCQKIEKTFLDFVPVLTLEILSPSTAFKDRHEKFELYEQQGVHYYVIVDPQFRKIEIYELVDGKYQPVAVTPSTFDFTLDGYTASVDFTNTWD
ncbi:MAG: Uma2 family endonuclease [Williamsia sp.]|nr:Uma2 family endonuclease [Williamsia sp.]